MFCTNCRASLPDTARFCSSCGTAVASAAASPPPSSSVLLSPHGHPQPAFERLASALFNALDQNIQPQRTGGLEVSKMQAYRTLGGLPLPPFYGEFVLPTYTQQVGIDVLRASPEIVISPLGWRQFLAQKIALEPDASYMHLARLTAALGVPVALKRGDFPAVPDAGAQAKENKFRLAVYNMARSANFGAGAYGGGYGGNFGGFGRFGGYGGGAGAFGQGNGFGQGGGNGKPTTTASMASAVASALKIGVGAMNIATGGGGGGISLFGN